MENSFDGFIKGILSSIMEEKYVNMLSQGDALRVFQKAFTSKTFDSSEENFDYEILEKMGDRYVNAFFANWMYEKFAQDIHVPNFYSKAEDFFTAKPYLADLSEKLGFVRWIRVAEGRKPNIHDREDVFEGFVGALIVAADTYVHRGLGMILAREWIYWVYNRYASDDFKTLDSSAFINDRDRINQIWQFNNWGPMKYRESSGARHSTNKGVKEQATADLIGPSSSTFPSQYSDKIIGSGSGETIEKARENACSQALKFLSINHAVFSKSETSFDALGLARIKLKLKTKVGLLRRLDKFLGSKSNTYEGIQSKQAIVGKTWHSQIRVLVNTKWINDTRATGDTEVAALSSAITGFLKNAAKQGKSKGRGRR